MARKQSRRSVSINRALHDVASHYAKLVGRPLSQITEDALCTAIAAELGSEVGDLIGELLNEARLGTSRRELAVSLASLIEVAQAKASGRAA